MGVEPSRSAAGLAGGRAACPADFFMRTRAARFLCARAQPPPRPRAGELWGRVLLSRPSAARRKVLISGFMFDNEFMRSVRMK